MFVLIGDGLIGVELYFEMVKFEFLVFFEYLFRVIKGILN